MIKRIAFFILSFVFLFFVPLVCYADDNYDSTINPPVNAYGNTNLFGFSWYEPEKPSTTTQSGYTYFTFNSYYLDKCYLVSFTDKNKYTYIYFVIPVEKVESSQPLNFGYIRTIFNHYNGQSSIFTNDDRNFSTYSDKQVLSTINLDDVDYYYYRVQIDYSYYQYMVTQSLPNYDVNCPYLIENIIRYVVANNKVYTFSYDDTLPTFSNLLINFKFETKLGSVADETSTYCPLTSITFDLSDALLTDGSIYDSSQYSIEYFLSSDMYRRRIVSKIGADDINVISKSTVTTPVKPLGSSIDFSTLNDELYTLSVNGIKLSPPLIGTPGYCTEYDTITVFLRLKNGTNYGNWYVLTYSYANHTALAQLGIPVGTSDSTLYKISSLNSVSGSASTSGGIHGSTQTTYTGTSTGGQPSDGGTGTGSVNDVLTFVQSVPAFMSAVFSWLPTWCITIIATCFTLLVVFSILKK